MSEANDKLMTDFAVRAMTAQPFSYLGAIAAGVRRAVDWRRVPCPGAYTVSRYRLAYRPEVLPANRAWIPGGTAAGDARAYGRASPSRVVAPFSSLIRAYQGYVFCYGRLFGLLLLAGLAGLIRRWRRLGGAGLLPWSVAVTLLLFPIATADFDYRYLLAAVPFAALAAGLAFDRRRQRSRWDKHMRHWHHGEWRRCFR